MLSSAVSEETFWKYICFHKAVRALKYSPKCVFNVSSKCVFIYFKISVLAVEHEVMFYNSPIAQEKWEGSQAGFVWKQNNQTLPKFLQLPPPPKELEWEWRRKQINELGTVWEWRKGGECRMWWDRAGRAVWGQEGVTAPCHPTPFGKNDHLQISAAKFRL